MLFSFSINKLVSVLLHDLGLLLHLIGLYHVDVYKESRFQFEDVKNIRIRDTENVSKIIL